MRQRLSPFSIGPFMAALCVLMLANTNSALGTASPHKQGDVPPTVGLYEAKPDGCSALGTIAGMVAGTVGGAILSEISSTAVEYYVSKGCSQIVAEAYARVAKAYENAYLRAEVGLASPGYPEGFIHDWAKVRIQDFSGGKDSSGNLRGDGWGAILWSGSSTDPSKVERPSYLGGAFWVAYKNAVNDPNAVGTPLYPGYPTSDEHVWPGSTVRIQNFEGGSWGDSAIIGTDRGAWIVAGRHWQAYWENDGQIALRNPLGPLYQDDEGWYTQDFEGGRIRELGGVIKVQIYESSDTPPELPAVGREDGAPPPANDSSIACSDAGIPQITSGLTYSPANPDTTTSVQFSFTITNIGCGTFQPEVLAIGGRDPNSGVSDPLQIRDFTLRPGESREISQTTVLSVPGTHEFFMVFLRVNGGWNEIPDTSGVSQHIYIDVIDAANEGADTSSNIDPIPPDSTVTAPASSQGNDLAPMDIGATGPNGHEIGAQFSVTTEDGEFIGSCILEGDAAAPYPLSCRVDVPRYTTVVVTLDVNSISPGYAPIENPMSFDTSSDPGAASHWGVFFQLEPRESADSVGESSEIVSDSTDDSGAVDIALITRDPNNGTLLTGTCYVLVDFSLEGCDENSDGQVTFADIPFGTYTVRQTQTAAGYSTINDYEIFVEPTGYMEGPSFGVPLSFTVKQASVQNAPDTRNVSVVFLDMATHERVTTGVCVELIGASQVGCDEDLIDGQADFLDVPAGGPYELSFSNLPAGFEVGTVGGPLAVTINAGPSDPANVMVFVLLAGSDGAGSASIETADSTSSNGAQMPSNTSGGTEATMLMTFRGCPEGFEPNTGDFYSECTIPLDAPDASTISWGGDGQGGMSITLLERQYDGAYIYNAGPDTTTLQLSGLAPILRDAYRVVGVDGVNGEVYAVNLVNGETREVFIFYYYE